MLSRASYLIAAITFLGLSGPALAADEPRKDTDVFDSARVWQVLITVSPEEYAAMQPRGGFGFGFPKLGPTTKDDKREVHRNNFGMDLPWATGAVVIGDLTFDKVGIRYKGNGTIGDAARTIKKSFKIDLDRAGGMGRFGGSKTINLHCGVADPSKFRETFGYELYRAAGVPAPKTTLAEVRLTVPGKHDKIYLGLYTIVQEVDKTFLKDNFEDEKGLLLKPEGVREFEDRGEKWDDYKAIYKPKREPEKDEASRVIAFAKLVHKADDATFHKEIESYIDVNDYLRFLAATAFIVNTDSYFVLGHNFYLYLHPKTRKFHFIPWDLDRAFSNLPILGSNNQQMKLSMVHPYPGTHRLTERVLALPGVSDRYQKLLKELSASTFEKDRLLKRLEKAETTMNELVERDAKAAAARKDGPSGFGFPMFGNPPTLKAFVEKRTASVTAQIAGTSKGYVPVGGGSPQIGSIMAGAMMEFVDKDQDDAISRAEWLAIVTRLFEASTKDKDGKADRKGIQAGLTSLLPPAPEGTPPEFSLATLLAGPIFARADANKDGKVTSEEMLAAAGEEFDAFDKGKAGKLEEDTFGAMLNKLFPFSKFAPPPPKK